MSSHGLRGKVGVLPVISSDILVPSSAKFTMYVYFFSVPLRVCQCLAPNPGSRHLHSMTVYPVGSIRAAMTQKTCIPSLWNTRSGRTRLGGPPILIGASVEVSEHRQEVGPSITPDSPGTVSLQMRCKSL
jgi:hypothetical protein